MKLAGQLLLACVVLTALKALVVGLVLGLGTTRVAGLIFRPVATARAVVTILATLAFVAHPIVCLLSVGLIVVIAHLIAKCSLKSLGSVDGGPPVT